MKLATRILIIPAFVWAALPPASYSLFALFNHWSMIEDLLVVLSCLVLTIFPYKKFNIGAWVAAYAFLVIITATGLIHHFQDSGESGPLPFEWINSYYNHSAPLLVIALLSWVPRKSHKDQQVVAYNSEQAR